MTIGLVYAMPGEIETLLTDETRTPIRTEAGVSFYHIRPHIIACCCGVSFVKKGRYCSSISIPPLSIFIRFAAKTCIFSSIP